MRFSVVIPTFNRARYLGLAIDSVLRQHYRPSEVIVVDDGSGDHTLTVAKAYGNRIVYIRQENRGVSAARNRGIRAAQGDWVAFLDSDDEWPPECLGRHAELLARYPGIVGSVMNCVYEAADGQKADFFEMLKVYGILRGRPDVLVSRPFRIVTEHHISFLQSCAFRRDVLMSTRLFDENITIAEDWDLIAQMALKGSFALCGQVGARMIRREENGENLSSQLTRQGIRTGLCWARVFKRILEEEQLTDEESRSLRKKYASYQRALGNLYLRTENVLQAHVEYRRAFSLDRSAASLGRLMLSFLPPKISRAFLFRGRHIDPGVHCGK